MDNQKSTPGQNTLVYCADLELRNLIREMQGFHQRLKEAEHRLETPDCKSYVLPRS